jgi:hypothetical protein
MKAGGRGKSKQKAKQKLGRGFSEAGTGIKFPNREDRADCNKVPQRLTELNVMEFLFSKSRC